MRKLLAALLVAIGIPALSPAAERKFDPQRHFPRDCYLYASVDVGGLSRAFRRTPIGEILGHPGIHKGLGALPEILRGRLRNATKALSEACGRDVLELAELFTGKIVFASSAHKFLAVELGPKKAEILELVNRLTALAASADLLDEAPKETTLKGRPATTVKLKIFQADVRFLVLGGFLVAAQGEGLEEIIERFEGGGDETGIDASPAFERAREFAGMEDSVVTCFFDMAAWRKLATQSAELNPLYAIISPALAAVGLDKLETFSYHRRMRDGDWEDKVVLKNSGPFQGFLKTLVESFREPSSLEPLERIPASASRVVCLSLEPGRFLREGLLTLKKLFPPLLGFGPMYDSAMKNIEEVTGLSVTEDLLELPRLSLYAFQASPPAGGLLPDTVVLLSSKEVEPYRAALQKIAARLAVDVTTVDVSGATVSCVRVGRPLDRLGLGRMLPGGFPQPGVSLSFASLDQDWIVVADSPQAISRYIGYYSKGPRLSDLPEVMSTIDGDKAAVALLRGGETSLMAYNALVDVSHQFLSELDPILGTYGVDPALFPPAEVFAPRFRDGFVIARRSEDALVVHGHRVGTHIAGDLVLDLVSLAATFADLTFAVQ